MSTTPSGWYADPSGKHQLRYWDGAAWTNYATTGGQQVVAPLTSQMPPPSLETVPTDELGREPSVPPIAAERTSSEFHPSFLEPTTKPDSRRWRWAVGGGAAIFAVLVALLVGRNTAPNNSPKASTEATSIPPVTEAATTDPTFSSAISNDRLVALCVANQPAENEENARTVGLTLEEGCRAAILAARSIDACADYLERQGHDLIGGVVPVRNACKQFASGVAGSTASSQPPDSEETRCETLRDEWNATVSSDFDEAQRLQAEYRARGCYDLCGMLVEDTDTPEAETRCN